MVLAAVAAGGAILSAGASVYGASTSASAAEDAAATQARSADRAQNAQMRMFTQTRNDQAPYRAAGGEALGRLRAGTRPGGQFVTPYKLNDFRADPGYKFRLQQGLKALDQSASSKGMLLSGAQQQGVQDYSQGLASQEYGNAYNRFQTDRTQRFNRLASLAGLGQTAVAQTGQAGADAAARAGEFGVQAGNARASGYIGASNALNQGISGVGNAAQGGLNTYLTLSSMNQQQATSPYTANYGGVDPYQTSMYNAYS